MSNGARGNARATITLKHSDTDKDIIDNYIDSGFDQSTFDADTEGLSEGKKQQLKEQANNTYLEQQGEGAGEAAYKAKQALEENEQIAKDAAERNLKHFGDIIENSLNVYKDPNYVAKMGAEAASSARDTANQFYNRVSETLAKRGLQGSSVEQAGLERQALASARYQEEARRQAELQAIDRLDSFAQVGLKYQAAADQLKYDANTQQARFSAGLSQFQQSHKLQQQQHALNVSKYQASQRGPGLLGVLGGAATVALGGLAGGVGAGIGAGVSKQLFGSGFGGGSPRWWGGGATYGDNPFSGSNPGPWAP